MQTTCTSLQTDNHTNTSSFNFYRPDALSDAQPTTLSTEGKLVQPAIYPTMSEVTVSKSTWAVNFNTTKYYPDFFLD